MEQIPGNTLTERYHGSTAKPSLQGVGRLDKLPEA